MWASVRAAHISLNSLIVNFAQMNGKVALECNIPASQYCDDSFDSNSDQWFVSGERIIVKKSHPSAPNNRQEVNAWGSSIEGGITGTSVSKPSTLVVPPVAGSGFQIAASMPFFSVLGSQLSRTLSNPPVSPAFTTVLVSSCLTYPQLESPEWAWLGPRHPALSRGQTTVAGAPSSYS